MDVDSLERFLGVRGDSDGEPGVKKLSKAEQEKLVMEEVIRRTEHKAKVGVDYSNHDGEGVQFAKLFGGEKRGEIRSGLKLSSFKKRVKKELKEKGKRPEDLRNGRRAVMIKHGNRDIDNGRLKNALGQLVADSHRAKIDEIQKKRERRREETGHAQAAAAPSKPEDYDPWEHFREKPLPTLSRRTAIDCGVNVIQQEMDRESSIIDRAERLGLTVELAAESINPHDASRLQLLYLHDDEAHRK
jgi:hypothetical protein